MIKGAACFGLVQQNQGMPVSRSGIRALEDFLKESDLFEADIVEMMDLTAIADARTTEGGTGREAVRIQLDAVEAALAADAGLASKA